MKFQYYELGHCSGGDTAVITLSGNAVNVRLMDSSNFQSYKAGRRHTCYGGLAKRSPVRIRIPHSGHWYVAIDFQGLTGSVRCSVRVEPPEPGPLPPIREQPLSSVPSLVRHPEESPRPPGEQAARDFDVFISHASEDKDDVVRPLAEALRNP